MKNITCEEARDLWDDHLIDNISQEQRGILDAHLETCPSCRRFTALLERVFAAVSAVEMDPLVRRRIAVAVAGGPLPVARAAHRGRRLAVAASVAALCAVGAAALLWAQGEKATLSPEGGPRRVAQARETEPRPASGGRSFAEIVAEERTYVEVFEGTGLALSAGASAFPRRADPQEGRFLLREGLAVAIVGPHEPGFHFIVETPSGAEIEAKGTVFAVEVDEQGMERVRVAEGVVQIRAPGQIPVALGAGRELTVGEYQSTEADQVALDADLELAFGRPGDSAEGAPRTEPPRSAGTAFAAAERALSGGRLDEAERFVARLERSEPAARETRELLSRLARAYRRARQFQAAADAYRRLIRNYGASESATNGLVALGEIELDVLGAFDDAVAHFDRYLAIAPKGYLAEAAAAGRVRALGRLGRASEARERAGEYLADYPEGPDAEEMRRLRAR